MNYEELKNYLSAEDLFFDNIVKPVARENGMRVSFSGSYIVFKKAHKKEANGKSN